MSKIDKLREAEARRLNKNSSQDLFPKGTDPEAIKGTVPEKSPKSSRAYLSWIIGLLFLILLLSNFAITFKEKNNSLGKLSKIEKIVTDNTQKIQDNHTKISQLEKRVSNQSTAIENLDRTQDTLFDRMNYLELKLDQSVIK